eukprot:3218233-Rhodomonas_salina.1
MANRSKTQAREVHELLKMNLRALAVLGWNAPSELHPVRDNLEVVEFFVQPFADGVSEINADID